MPVPDATQSSGAPDHQDLVEPAPGAPDPRQAVVSSARLVPVGARPSLGDYTKQLWQRRYFLWAEAQAKLAAGTRETILGTAWLVLKPMLDGLTYFLIFGLLLKSNRGIDNFLGYLVVGVFLFSFTTRCVSNGASSVANGRNMIRAFAFPRASLPIAVVLREVINMAWVFVAMFVLVLSLPTAEVLTWRVVLLPGIFALQVIMCTGLALLLARWTAAVPDLKVMISFFTRLWLYGSAVFFSYERFIEHPGVLRVMEANPMFIVLDMARASLLYGTTPTGHQWAVLSAWAFGSLIVGYLVFWRAEETYGRA